MRGKRKQETRKEEERIKRIKRRRTGAIRRERERERERERIHQQPKIATKIMTLNDEL